MDLNATGQFGPFQSGNATTLVHAALQFLVWSKLHVLDV